ncbi:MAG: HAD-IC family P-type ATPase, partial [Alphaproteobacteria bacterium]|nr:HAD-IC family P-type ATPase [Alphaproteobacteria bacterium]
AVHAAAALAFLAWYVVLDASLREALLIAVAVLIVTCPCALALAQPAVATAVVGRLARHGILVVSPTALERLGAVDTVVFDKTGTLTMGRPTLRPDPQRPAEALALAAAIAANSRHPLARALAAAAPSETPADEVTEHPGLGLSWRDVRLGSRRFCGLPDDGDDDAAELWLARPGLPPVRFAFSDSLRPGARQTVAKLRHRGLKVVLLSGDRASAVAGVAAETGIDDWSAGLTPEAKLQRIGALSAAGRRVLMVGDGINDAPSLAAAHASMSPGDATDVASAAADALFRGPSLDGVAVALDAAQGAIGRMRANLAIALVYNLIAVPVAMLGLLTPPVAAAAMSASSLLVVLNAVRLGRDRASPASAGRRA